MDPKDGVFDTNDRRAHQVHRVRRSLNIDIGLERCKKYLSISYRKFKGLVKATNIKLSELFFLNIKKAAKKLTSAGTRKLFQGKKVRIMLCECHRIGSNAVCSVGVSKLTWNT